MKRLFAALLVVTVMIGFTAVANCNEKPKEYTSVEMFASDEAIHSDFELQGEYLGQQGELTLGLNLIARSEGRFDLVVFLGGLPGQGWARGDLRFAAKGTRESTGMLAIVMDKTNHADAQARFDETEGKFTLKIEDKDSISCDVGDARFEFKKVVRKSPTEGLKMPEGGVPLFVDGKKSELFEQGNVNEQAGTLWAEARTQPFEKKPYTLHVEFMTSYMPAAQGQARANSGVYIDEAYECQVLDSFGLDGKNNECGGFYQIAEPKVNMCFPPLSWQTYDIDFAPAMFDEEGTKIESARITVKHNGVTIHDEIQMPKQTPGCKKEDAQLRGLYLQGHGNKVQYRNIWLKYK